MPAPLHCLPAMQAWDQNVFNHVAHEGMVPFQPVETEPRLVSREAGEAGLGVLRWIRACPSLWLGVGWVLAECAGLAGIDPVTGLSPLTGCVQPRCLVCTALTALKATVCDAVAACVRQRVLAAAQPC